MDMNMYGKMSDDRRIEESPTCGLTNKPTKEGVMSDKEKRAQTIERIKLYMSVMTDSQLKSLLGAARGINNARG